MAVGETSPAFNVLSSVGDLKSVSANREHFRGHAAIDPIGDSAPRALAIEEVVSVNA